MNRKFLKVLGVAFICTFFMTSCYSYTTIVGDGAQGKEKVTKWNHYAIGGLAPISVSDARIMSGGASDYEITTRQTFINGVISGMTGGIYTPTTTTVKK